MHRMFAAALLPLSLLVAAPLLAQNPLPKQDAPLPQTTPPRQDAPPPQATPPRQDAPLPQATPPRQDAPPGMSPEEAAMMEAYQKAGALGDAHAALAKMAGSYDLSIKSWNAPGAPPTVETGTATRTLALGGRVLVEDVQSQMYGQPFTGHGMHGYDNVSGKHWSTWNDSMSTGLMVSEGDCDATGACTFTGSWNDAVTRKPIKARMTTKWTSPDVEVFEMFAPGPDGKEGKMMEITYTKK